MPQRVGMPGRALWAAALLTGLLPALPAAGTTCVGFRPTRTDMRGSPPVLGRPIAAMPGDFNRDGIPDIAVVNKFIDPNLQNGSISILTATADGNLTIGSTQIIEAFSQWAVSGDFNEDKVPDVAAVTVSGELTFLGDGAGGFLPQPRIALTHDPFFVTAADMNADGHLDLVVVQQWISSSTGQVTVMLGNGQGGFTLMPPASVGQDPHGAVVADFDGDGRPDVVTANNLSNDLTFLPGLGNGGFGAARTTPLTASGAYPAAADFNHDGRMDLVVTSETVASPALILFGLGDGTFILNATLPAGDTPRNPLLCDFDHDGTLDIAVPDQGGGEVALMFGGPGGSFEPPIHIGTDGGPSQASVKDINGDGFCDVVTANEGNNSVSVLVGGPRGTIGTPTVNVGRAPVDVATADFNHDGHLDLAVANRDDGTVSFHRGDGEGGFYLSQTLAVGVNPVAVAADDFDGDGFSDVVVALQGVNGDTQNDSIAILQNDTTGGFFIQSTWTVGDAPLDLKTADFNGDGRPDIVVANSRSDKISFLLSAAGGGFGNVKNIRLGTPQRDLAPADLNGDGIMDVAVALMGGNVFMPLLGTSQGGFQAGASVDLGGAFLIDRVVAGDLDGDGKVDLLAASQASDGVSPGQLVELIGNGDATFSEPFPRQATGVDPEGLGILDLDRAGGPDIVVANRLNNDVTILLGAGNGVFTLDAERYGSGNGPYHLAIGDFNEDFRADLITANYSGNTVSVMLNNYPIADPIGALDVTPAGSLSWTAMPGASSYRLYRGNLSQLDRDNFGGCLQPNVSSTQYTDPQIPAPGDGFFYLVTAMLNGSEGPLGYSSDCVSRPNFNACFVP